MQFVATKANSQCITGSSISAPNEDLRSRITLPPPSCPENESNPYFQMNGTGKRKDAS